MKWSNYIRTASEGQISITQPQHETQATRIVSGQREDKGVPNGELGKKVGVAIGGGILMKEWGMEDKGEGREMGRERGAG